LLPLSLAFISEIYTVILRHGLGSLGPMASQLMLATLMVHSMVKARLPALPARPQCRLDISEIARVMEGLLAFDPRDGDEELYARLWSHECKRVYADRQISEEDRDFISTSIRQVASQQGLQIDRESFFTAKLNVHGERSYEEVSSLEEVRPGGMGPWGA
jgi:hypothetical protein